MPPYQPRIAIIGGGPAGLTLGMLLHKKGVSFTIYDLRSRPTSEDLSKPCGMLDLHEESGQAAIRDGGLYEAFLPLTGECTEESILIHRNGRQLYHHTGGSEEGGRPEISRHALIKLLLSNIPPEMIKWNHKVSNVTTPQSAAGHTETTVDFGINGKETFDLVIGADGAWSKVRAMLTPVKPEYSGVQMITVDLRSVSIKYPQVSRLLGGGTMFALGHGNGVLSQRGANGAARIYLAISTPDANFGEITGLAHQTAAEAKKTLLNEQTLFADFGDNLKEIISLACDEDTADEPDKKLDIKPLYMLPAGHRWNADSGATLVGDAAHLMPPWAGEGVNLAMWDCQDLSQTIVEAVTVNNADAIAFQKTLAPLLRKFEKDMQTRSAEKAQETLENKATMLDCEDGSTAMMRFFESVLPDNDLVGKVFKNES